MLPPNAHSQGNNAVSITIMGSGQYSSVLSDFYEPSKAGMLTVVILNQDFKEAQIPVQLFMSVTHSFDKQPYITTKTPNPTQIINLKSNVPLTLTGKDLECIFNTAYLTYKGPNLKDGNNILKIYARDVRTGKVVSNTAQISLRSIMISPPRLTSPDNNIVLEHNYATQLFQWQPDNGGAYKPPQYNYRLRFCLWKLHGNDPYVEVLRKPDVDVVSIFSDKYEMILSTYHFEIGQRYCWRVKAEDPFEKMNIINDGWSDVRTFTYKHLPVPVTGVSHTVNLSNRKATVTWTTAEGHTKYYVETYNPQTDAHNTIETYDPKYTLMPAPDEEYKMLVRVKAQCWNDDSRQSSWTPWDTIHYPAYVKPESKYPCGYKFPKVEVTNLELKTDFKEGDIVSEANGSSDYEIINCRAAADGTLEGQFYLIMNAWGGAKIACEFWDTKINTDNIIITTRYESIDTPIGMVDPEALQQYVKSLWLDANSVATSSKIKDTIVIKEKFDYLYRNENGEYMAVIVHPDGSTEETKANTFGSPNQCLVTDGQGDTVAIDKNGQVMGVKEYRATGGNKVLLNEYHRKSDSLAQWQINFKPATNQTYAFDYLKSGNHGIFATNEYYPISGKYDFRYKSIESSKTDRVVVDFGSYSEKDSVIFKDKYGVKLKVVDGNILTFTGVSKADTNYIYAYRGDQKIGKLFLNTYQKKTYKVVLVSVNKATLPDIGTLENYLNKVYNQCAVQFEISTDKITLNDLTSFSHGGSGVFTVYNDDQKKVLSAYDKDMKDGVYYLFFVDNVTDKKDGNGTLVSGYMPRGYNAGFIYDGGSEHTIAHELGHGIAGLEHVFENSNNSGKTANLMDYASGEELWHFQWDQIQDPSRVWMKWNKAESEGENVEDIIIPRTNWRLVIYSPDESKKFLKAYEKNDYYEMRRITYYSLFHEFEGENKDWWQKQEKFGGQSLRPMGYSVARLDYFEDAKEGMTVILSTYDKNMNIVFDPNVLYFKPFYSWTKYTPIFWLDVEEPITQTFEGICYPVDINLYDKKTKSLGGKEFYGDNDFVGVEVSLVGMAGITFDKVFNEKPPFWQELLNAINIGQGGGVSILYGSMKGYGVCLYWSYIQLAVGPDISISVSKAEVNGKLTPEIKSQPDYWSFGPKSLEGDSRSFNASLMFNNYEHWEGLSDGGEVLWEGINTGLTFDFLGAVDGGFNFSKEKSKLINLDFIFKKYNNEK